MIKELMNNAYHDLTVSFWDDKLKNFIFSENERITSPSITSVCLWAILEYNSSDGWIEKHKTDIQTSLIKSYPWTDAGNHYTNNMAMAFGYIGLLKLNSKENQLLNEVKNYLCDNQNEDGGWGFNEKIPESHPYFTYWVTYSLLLSSPDEVLWDNHISKSLKYYLEIIRAHNSHPTSYNMIQHGITLITTKYYDYIDESLQKTLQKIKKVQIERYQYKNGDWKNEPPVVDAAYFKKTLFSMKNLYFLSETDYKPISETYANMLNWIQSNYKSPGWPSDANHSVKGFSWTTAYILLGLLSYKRTLEKVIN